METLITLPWVDWGMGSVLIGVFAVVVFVMVFIVLGMMKSKKKAKKSEAEETE
ncbi:hypothetical protein POV27_14175 [Aureisphaera galaxeae]|uniref:hypothetical protein n=1 Tax=Aureisphaera galaxeae TaxID=1538023 RepID=UPI0023502C60|nr:hypothetical protein [Aureisphaera galaxeae]MDC8005204.1 hypothetical protein [Aureisphaera galaxeae]